MRNAILLTLLLLTACCLQACSDDTSAGSPDADDLARPYEITVIFTPNGLGDMGYNDLALQGLQRFYKNHTDMRMYFNAPRDMSQAESIFREWASRPAAGRSLCILATSDFEDLVTAYFQSDTALPDGKEVLLFESDNPHDLPISTFRMSLYGASFLAGVCAASLTDGKGLAVGGSSSDASIRSALDGLADGYAHMGRSTPDVVFLSDGFDGYAMPDKAYRNMAEWSSHYDFVYPVAGGSNLGIYKYLRDYASTVHTAGMDVDQSHLCNKVTGSAVKHLDRLLAFYLNLWLSGTPLPAKAWYGLGSGFVDYLVAPDYGASLGNVAEACRQTAIDKENAYEE